jgi:gamma-glutamyltranspeptidase / glutathione hydrolase
MKDAPMKATRPTTLATNGMVATPHYLATGIGLRILQDGGSAMDAALAANAALTVVYPDQTSVGGDCFFLVHDAATGDIVHYNGSGAAPMAADPAALLDQGYTGMPRYGPLPITVPGTVDAWVAGHERFGKLELTDVLNPAIALARDGFPVSPRLAGVLAAQADAIWQNDALAAVLFPNGAVPATGESLPLPHLAASLQAIVDEGRDVFYRGAIAEEIVATIAAQGGWMTLDDLDAHQGEWNEPLQAGYRGTTVLGSPPNSQGLTSLLGLRLVEQVDVGSAWGALAHVHPLVEAKKRAFAVRNAYLGDPRFVDIDTGYLLSDQLVGDLWADYSPDTASAGQPTGAGDTVYLCVIDRDGNAVSLIQSMYQSFGSWVVAGNTGIILHNRGSYFSLDPESPNVLAPGKRPLHTLMPSMLQREGVLHGLVGTQGGDAQAQVHLQLISNLVDFGMEPQAAIEEPRWIAGGPGGSAPLQVLMELGFPEGTVQGLGARGHQVTLIDPWNPDAGHAQMILIDWERGVLQGAADPRADGSAAGY